MTSTEQFAFQVAKEITIAKLSSSSPAHTNTETGESIGDMFNAIYKKILATVKS
ncbi:MULTISPECIES: hypothetical protein [Eisenbergiella]|uniref:hypothetical protein n=1 Tax=Eisenbergiella TaxID=1432051 RepID=UPI0023F1802A|nr:MULTISPECIES: hypothetical protein [Eisenbergiella]MDY2652444.1 hypothetical protein [Eisenbergiella porci]